MRILAPPGVFCPIAESWLLAEAVREEDLPANGRALDLCTGSGVVAIAAARRGLDVTAVDVSRRAVATTRLNARLNRAPVRAVRGSLFEPVGRRRFDCITANPPYVPSSHGVIPRRGAARAWEGGCDGRVVLDRICREAPRHLAPGGAVLLTHSDLIGEDRTLALLEEGGLEVDMVRRVPEPLGPLMCARREDGLIGADVDAEEVLVIRGRRPLRPARPRPRVRLAVS